MYLRNFPQATARAEVATAVRNPCTTVLLVGMALLGLAGCSSLMTQNKVSGVTETVFDDRLPTGMADYWNNCMVKALIWPKDTQLDLHGTCPTVQNVPTGLGQIIYAAAVQKSPFKLKIPVVLTDIRTEIANWPWPAQNCAVEANTQVIFRVLGFAALAASWQEHNSTPALLLRLTNPPAKNPYAPAIRDTVATADCPSPINKGYIRQKLDKSRFNGSANITFKKMDLDVYVLYSLQKDGIAVTTDVVPDFAGLDPGIKWDTLPKSAKTGFSKQIGSLDSAIGDELNGYFTGLGAIFAEAMNTALPKGHRVCNLAIRNGTFVITTDDANDRRACQSG